jgi:hypothetical protein
MCAQRFQQQTRTDNKLAADFRHGARVDEGDEEGGGRTCFRIRPDPSVPAPHRLLAHTADHSIPSSTLHAMSRLLTYAECYYNNLKLPPVSFPDLRGTS